MSRDPGPFIFTLNNHEIQELSQPAGEGGFQTFQERLINELSVTGDQISLSDEELGKLVRYMTRYKSGGFQGHLREAFIRSFKELLGL